MIHEQLETVETVIVSRRTSLRMDSETPVSRELVNRLLRLATFAPNHKRTWPWRFAVITGDGRRRLGAVVAAWEVDNGAPPERVTSVRAKYLRAPVLVVVGVAHHADPTRRVEDRDAVAAGIQNVLLGATAAGLASHWATGTWMQSAAVKELVGSSHYEELVGLIYLGWPTGAVPDVPRPAPVIVTVC